MAHFPNLSDSEHLFLMLLTGYVIQSILGDEAVV